MDREQQKQRLDDLLKMIGGLEESIRMSLENGDKEFANNLRPLKKQYYERLKRVSYGLPEQRTVETETSS